MSTTTHRVITALSDLPDDSYPTLIDDVSAYWYAWGRMDQGHPPVLGHLTLDDSKPSKVTSAWEFGRMWARAKAALRSGEQTYVPSLQDAWANFVASGGHTLYRS